MATADNRIPAPALRLCTRGLRAFFRRSCLLSIRNSLLLWIVIFAFYQIAAPNYCWLAERGDTPYGADFLQEWVGARMVLEGDAKNLYNTALFQARQHEEQVLGFGWDASSFFPPVYPPMHYVAFIPFAIIPYRWAVLVWLGVLIAFAILASHQIRRIALSYASDKFASPSQQTLLKTSIGFGLILFPTVLSSLAIGQKSVIWLVILASAWQLLLQKRDLSAGLVFGLMSIKPTLFFLLPLVLLSRGKFKFFLGASITVASLWGVALCMMPSEVWFGFLKMVLGGLNYPDMNGYRLDWSCNLLSLSYAIPTAFQSWCKQSVCVILAIYCLMSCFERSESDVLSPEKLLHMLCVTFLLSPHAYSYDLCMFLLPVFWIGAQQPRVGFVYYTLLTMAVASAAVIWNALNLPILPVVLVGIVCELRLRMRRSESKNDPCVPAKHALAAV